MLGAIACYLAQKYDGIVLLAANTVGSFEALSISGASDL